MVKDLDLNIKYKIPTCEVCVKGKQTVLQFVRNQSENELGLEFDPFKRLWTTFIKKKKKKKN